MTAYDEYLRSDVWQYKRECALSRAGRKCERCGAKYGVALEVHHLTYERFGNERMDDLEVLCKRCHEAADLQRTREAAEEAEAEIAVALDTIETTAATAGFNGWAEHVFGKDWPNLPFGYVCRHYHRSRTAEDPMAYDPRHTTRT